MIRKVKTNRLKAFTLVETLLSSAIAVVLVGFVTSFFLNMVLGKQSFLIEQELEYNTQFALQIIQEEIREATGVNQGTSVFVSHPGTLSLSKNDFADDPTIITSSGNDLTIQKGTDDPLSLIGDKVEISNLVFNFVDSGNTPGTVAGDMTLTSTIDSTVTKSENFSVSLRVNNP